ncbi:Hexose carrier protein HEX6 [Linum perenne]
MAVDVSITPPEPTKSKNHHYGFQLKVLGANLINFGMEKIKTGYGWRISLGIAAVPAAILTVRALFLPETPSSVIQRTNNQVKAMKVLEQIK